MENMIGLFSKLFTEYKTKLLQLLIKWKLLKTLNFYRDYIVAVELVQFSSQNTVWNLRYFQFTWCLIVVHYFFLWFSHEALDRREQVLHFNWLVLNGFPSFVNLYAALLLLFTAKGASLMYFENNRAGYRLLRQILLENDGSFFLLNNSQHIKEDKPFKPNFLKEKKKKNDQFSWAVLRNECSVTLQRIQLIALFVANLLSSITFLTCKQARKTLSINDHQTLTKKNLLFSDRLSVHLRLRSPLLGLPSQFLLLPILHKNCLSSRTGHRSLSLHPQHHSH